MLVRLKSCGESHKYCVHVTFLCGAGFIVGLQMWRMWPVHLRGCNIWEALS